MFCHLFRSRIPYTFFIACNEFIGRHVGGPRSRKRVSSIIAGRPVKRITFTSYRHPSATCFCLSSHTFLTLPPDHDEFLVLSLSPIRRNRRILLLLRCRTPFFQPSPLGLVARAFAQPSPSSFPSFLTLPPSSINTSVTQDISHLSFSRHTHFIDRPNPNTPIPNGTDACWSVCALIPITDVPVHLPTDPPEIVPGPSQPARICACIVRPLDARSERLEISITRPAFRSGT